MRNRFLGVIDRDFLGDVFKRCASLKSRSRERCVQRSIHDVYGIYSQDECYRFVSLLCSLRNKLRRTPLVRTMKIHRSLLSIDCSSKERLPVYPTIYKKIFAITGVPRSIVDYACGVNPLSFVFMNLPRVYYYAFDINPVHCAIVRYYFRILGKKRVEGKVRCVDLKGLKRKIVSQKVDVCFLFEFLDLTDLSVFQRILCSAKAQWYVLTFPRTIRRGDLRYQRKRKLEVFLRSYDVKSFICGKEKVYCVRGYFG